ncbi:hypothetical protein Q7C36_005091 [Tachysurus vachellii]|uniref:Uncharacterized protein n=1 Tax=Tachysurus vachellii TaxID=175792 RepID=A0AA88T298_TACVA|nr:uncharacterized protein LOC132848274 isoform X2 [Tachysurus vachellii]KAK2860925.1 hypothetical protein Q7C36_005091 [Tachysurus vachellii]
MLLVILLVGAVIFTEESVAQTAPSDGTANTDVTVLNTNATTLPSTTVNTSTAATTQTTSLTNGTTNTGFNDRNGSLTSTTTLLSTTVNTSTTATTQTTSLTNGTANTGVYVYPIRLGLRALVRSSVPLDKDSANIILQRYLGFIQYYNIRGKVTSIKRL